MMTLPQELKSRLDQYSVFALAQYMNERAQTGLIEGMGRDEVPTTNSCAENCFCEEKSFKDEPVYMLVLGGEEFDTLESAQEHVQELLDEGLLNENSCVVRTTLRDTWEITKKAELVPSIVEK